MAGITFLRTRNREALREFYLSQIGMEIWLEQAECTLLKHGNLLLGFCSGEAVEKDGLITFFYPDRTGVDALYEKMKGRALGEPEVNEKYRIYHFFAEDPEERALEFQAFLHPLAPYHDGDTLMRTRRSVRAFSPTPVPETVLDAVFETCRFSPTSMNSQSYGFVVVRSRSVLDRLAELRGNSSAPLARAPLGVAVTGDPKKSGAHQQDAIIAATHFLLAAWAHGLGTCWIGAMDRPEVKEALEIPSDHSIATVTPLGYPAETPDPGERRTVREMVRIVD
ncbi:MAG: nitroreductase family protein [Planctomycetota bacterium]|jgi:nitroreductase